MIANIVEQPENCSFVMKLQRILPLHHAGDSAMPKAEILLEKLTDAERKRLSGVMKSHKRDSLRQLFRYLLKVAVREISFDKDKAFRTAFGRAYSPEEDYLLRNEFRLLTSEIHDFLREEELRRECESNQNFNDTLLLSSLLRHQCFDELERLFPKAFAASLERLNFEQARRQSDIYFQYLIFHRPITPQILENGRALMAEQMRVLKIIYRTGALLNQNNRANCEAMLAMVNRPVEELPVNPALDTDFSAAETPFIRFMEAMFSAQLEADLDRRITLARDAVESISEVQKIYPVEKLLALGTLATLHYIKSDYHEARTVFEQAIDYAREANLPSTINRVEPLYNYVGTLIWRLRQGTRSHGRIPRTHRQTRKTCSPVRRFSMLLLYFFAPSGGSTRRSAA